MEWFRTLVRTPLECYDLRHIIHLRTVHNARTLLCAHTHTRDMYTLYRTDRILRQARVCRFCLLEFQNEIAEVRCENICGLNVGVVVAKI